MAMLRRARDPDAEPEAPPLSKPLPWGSRQDLDLELIEPPRPLAISAELTEEDVEQIQSLAAGRKFSLPVVLVLLAYFGLKTYFGDALPDVVLYVLLGLTFVVNALMSMRKDRHHYARPGQITMTFSADGVEVSAENWAGHVPWVLVDRFERADDMVVVHAATKPSLHAMPVRQLDPWTLTQLDVWAQYAARRRHKRPGRALFALAIVGLLLLGGFWFWDRLGRPMPVP